MCVLHNTVINREGSDEASLMKQENFQESFNCDEFEGQLKKINKNLNYDRAKSVGDAFTVCFNSDVDWLPESNLWL